MKGYDIVVFPREGDSPLIALEPQREDAERTAWTDDIRLFKGYDERDPRPPGARAVELAQEVVREAGFERIGLELSLGTQASDRMVGEPTTYTHAFFHAFGAAEDATPLLAEARAVKTAQEIERMRLANELAARAMEYVRRELRPGMKESEAGALWEGFVHGEGTGYQGKVELARGFALVWSGPGIRTFTATGDRPVQEREPTLFEIWVCVDGYWCDHTKNVCPGELTAEYEELLEKLLAAYRGAGSVGLYDTTLRDGEQTVGVVLSPEDKLEIARALDELGIDRIEAGFPRVSEDDRRAFELILAAGLTAEVWGFSRAVEADVKALVELGVEASVIESPVSDLKLDALGVDREAMLERIVYPVSFAARESIYVCFFGVDGTR